MEKAKCRVCGIEKNKDDFYPDIDKRTSIVRFCRCKECMSIKSRTYHRTIDGVISLMFSRQKRASIVRNMQHLEILNQEYNEVTTESGVIYCDPPYQDTAEYNSGLNHAIFWEWVKNHRLPVFISSYAAPENIIEIASFEHRCTLSATANNKVVEKLFWNGVKQ